MTVESERIQYRISVISIAVIFLMGIIITRLLFLQVLTGAEYLRIAKENKIRIIETTAPRGSIYDRHAKPMVSNRIGLTVSINKTQFDTSKKDYAELQSVINNLSGVLGMPVPDIKKKLENVHIGPYQPVPIKEDIPQETAIFIKEHELEFPHVSIDGQPIREYANGSLAAHILGYLGEISDKELKDKKYKGYSLGDVIGREGVERSYEKYLAGVKGEGRIEVNAEGYPISSLVIRKPQAGKNVYLTIDKDLQNLSESLLADALEQARNAYDQDSKKYYKAPAGAVVVMNPNNGEVLAMASQPSYDPGLFTRGVTPQDWQVLNDPNNHYPLNNRAMTNSYPPGSTIKVITSAAAMQEGIASAGSEYDCAGKWTGAGDQWPQFCWLRTGHGHLTLEEGIIESCDTVFYEIGLQFYRLIGQKGEKMQEWAAKFGLGSPTGIDLPGEDGGRIPTSAWKKKWNKDNDPQYQVWYPGDSTNMAIGQGDVLATPLQMAVVYSAVANGGVVYKPHVVKRVESANKDWIKEIKAEKVRDLGISADVLGIIRSDLEQVITDGTGKTAFQGFSFSTVTVGGKTGSAEMYGRQANAWFAAVAPADKPQYVVVVMIEEGGHGVSAAAPVARKIIENIYGLRSDSDIRIESTVD